MGRIMVGSSENGTLYPLCYSHFVVATAIASPAQSLVVVVNNWTECCSHSVLIGLGLP